MLAAGGLESARHAFADGRPGKGPVLIVAEADLSRADRGLGLMDAASSTIVIDHSSGPTTEAADIVLPASTILEGSGTFVSFEGRAQRFFAMRKAAAPVLDSWRWLDELAAGAARSLDAIDAAIAEALPELAAITRAAPASRYRLVGRRIARGARRRAAALRYSRTSIRESPIPRLTLTRAWPTQWKGPSRPRLRSCPVIGRLDGIPIRRSTSSKWKSGVSCAAAR